jgi:hypothetical protein
MAPHSCTDGHMVIYSYSSSSQYVSSFELWTCEVLFMLLLSLDCQAYFIVGGDGGRCCMCSTMLSTYIRKEIHIS